MDLRRRSKLMAVMSLFASILLPLAAWAQGGTDEVNLLSWGEGAVVVQATGSESNSGQWSADALLDEYAVTGWASKRGDLTTKVLVFELANKSQITNFVFDTAQAYSRERCAKDVSVEISDRKDDGFTEILKASLAPLKDGQKFVLKSPASGRYLKLTVFNNYGDKQFMEIMNFKGYGKPLEKRSLGDNTGTYSSTYGAFHLQQRGAAVTGCYDQARGLVENGGFEGRVLRFTWSAEEPPGHRIGGPAMLIFSDDGQTFYGHYWHADETNRPPRGDWIGKRVSTQIGSCPNWTPDAGSGSGVEQQLQAEGRARLYGILFDTDSDHIKAESEPTLDSLLAAARDQPTWNFDIEGHTDNTGGDAHNQILSEKRAAAVKAYLVNAGVDPKRLTSQGFGATRPVASNDTALGRSQNRRVEIVKK